MLPTHYKIILKPVNTNLLSYNQFHSCCYPNVGIPLLQLAHVVVQSLPDALHHALTDDEFAYQFSAELLTQGKLYLHSFPMKDFFDHKFL